MFRSFHWGYPAVGWAVVFASVHFFWALGGEAGLDISAGQQLAAERPGWFVAGGLWGVGCLCLIGALAAFGLTRRSVSGLRRRLLTLLGYGVGALLLLRGIGIEVLILADAPGIDVSVGSAQRFWTLVLWNPWFVLGGVLFALAAHGFGKNAADCISAAPR
ncbi:DUF3995 domain-containing protein [Amycolatopsis sp. H20-H5]|uniref:DUF3995 domain-containing protein n=1 Tax=Amycolatopsis sp. H20-H5 TaxID=3046309 RepID=UPI002DBA39C4|nr:DUF3995 domain-containing protein [Amycolatopsis sp. H20-H5]MEC3976811.1 DUF3995 domain-containing protein [Amycolatopsis sp. H20-H5]